MDPLIEAYLGIYDEAFNDKGEFVREGPAPAPAQPKPENSSHSKKNKKPQIKKEELEYILDVLVSEGFAVDYDGAVCILEAMSDEWVDCILDEKHVKAMDFKGRGPDRRTRFPRFYGMDNEFDPTFIRKRVNVNDKRIDPYFTGRRERKAQRRQGVGGFNV